MSLSVSSVVYFKFILRECTRGLTLHVGYTGKIEKYIYISINEVKISKMSSTN